MPGTPYIGSDGRPRIKGKWTTPALNDPDKEFLLDSGSSRSVVRENNAAGLTVIGLIGVGTSASISSTVFEMSGGTIEFDVTDRHGQQKSVSWSKPVLVMKRDILGTDVLSDLSLKLVIDVAHSRATLEEA